MMPTSSCGSAPLPAPIAPRPRTAALTSGLPPRASASPAGEYSQRPERRLSRRADRLLLDVAVDVHELGPRVEEREDVLQREVRLRRIQRLEDGLDELVVLGRV